MTLIKQDSRSSGDYLFDNDPFEFGSSIQHDDLTRSPTSDNTTHNNNNNNHLKHHSSGIGFLKSISSLAYGELSPKKQSHAVKARLDPINNDQPGVHAKSFLDTARESSKIHRVRSVSPDRISISSNRSNGSMSLSRTHSNTLSKLGLTTTRSHTNTPKNDTPFDDSDDDWSDTLDDFNNLRTVNNGYSTTSFTHPHGNNINNKNPDDDNYELPKSMEKLEIKDTNVVEECDPSYPFLKKNYQDIMKDPYSILSTQKPPREDIIKYNKIVKELTKSNFQLSELKKQSWSGIPKSLRSLVWQILVGYLSTNNSTRTTVLTRKRKEYTNSIARLFRSEKDATIWHQIKIDVLRTNPSIKLYSFEATHRSLEKILYLWAIRHPASGYVQDINDLVTPFYQVFLEHYLSTNIDVETFDPQNLPNELINIIEADTYWCLTKVLDTIQDNFIHEQPGIIRQITELKNLIKRDEPQLSTHFEKENLDFIQFAFRWMNCMLMREFKLNLIIRMWDTYLSDFPTGFSQFHIYVCCAFLRRFSDHLMEMEFQDIIMFLQDTSKTEDWNEDDIEMMLSEAYVWQSLYENASAHLK